MSFITHIIQGLTKDTLICQISYFIVYLCFYGGDFLIIYFDPFHLYQDFQFATFLSDQDKPSAPIECSWHDRHDFDAISSWAKTEIGYLLSISNADHRLDTCVLAAKLKRFFFSRSHRVAYQRGIGFSSDFSCLFLCFSTSATLTVDDEIMTKLWLEVQSS